MNFLLRSILIFVIIVFHERSFAQSPINDHLDSTLMKYNKEGKFSGAVSVFRGETEIYSYHVGDANFSGTRRPLDSSSLFPIGSITKTYTTVLTFILIEKGRIHLNDTLKEWLPDMPYSDQITLRSLLEHRSGITDENYFKWKVNGAKFKLVKGYSYSNVGYGLLGKILEKVEGIPLDSMYDVHIIKPLGLEDTYFGFDPSLASRICESRSIANKTWSNSPGYELDSAGGAGAIVSTPEDVNLFVKALFEGKLISEGSLAQIKRSSQLGGMGMYAANYGNIKGYTNSGSFGNYISSYVIFPDNNTTVCFCSNQSDINVNNLLLAITAHFLK